MPDLDFKNSLNHKESGTGLRNGERREVTILFADVKNSTVMGASMDPELFKRKIDMLMKALSRCVEFYGGHVDKYMGDGIMALYGAKKTTEHDVERAIVSGLKMLGEVQAYNQIVTEKRLDPSEYIMIRIGISSGLVAAGKVGIEREGDFTAMGSPVALAKRMEEKAPVNTILMPVETMHSAQGSFVFRLFGHVQVEGLERPVESYTVVGPRDKRCSCWRRYKTTLIGRDREIGVLQCVFSKLGSRGSDKAKTRACASMIGICGDAGMGKTRLIRDFCTSLGDKVSVVSAEASGIVTTPYHTVKSLLEDAFNLPTKDDPASRKTKFESEYALLSSYLDNDDESLDVIQILAGSLLDIDYPDTRTNQDAQDLALHRKLALRSLLRAIIRQRTESGISLIIVLDDLHWLDEASCQVFGFILPELMLEQDDPRLGGTMFMLSYRKGYILPEEITDCGCFQELELSPLSEFDMNRLVRKQVEEFRLSDAVLDKVGKLSLGNPFYLEEWCNYLSDLHKYDPEDIPVPPTLNALILSRLDLLDDSIRLLLQKASVIGNEFFVDILRWIEQRLGETGEVEDTLQLLEKQDYIMELLGFDYSAYFFKHIVTRDVAYQTLLLENRAILHKLAAEAIEDLYPEPRRDLLFKLADHYHRAGLATKAVFYLLKAAKAAEKYYANDQAIDLYTKLLNWLEHHREDMHVGENDLPAAELSSGIGADTGYNREGHVASEITPARVLLHLVEIKNLIGEWDAADEDLLSAGRQAEKSGVFLDKFDFFRLTGISAFRRGNLNDARQAWEQCQLMADAWPSCCDTTAPNQSELSRQILQAISHSNLGIWHQHQKQWEQALQHYKTSLEAANQAGDGLRAAKTMSNLGFLLIILRNFIEAENYLKESLRLAEENLNLQLQSIALGNLGFLFYKQGELEQATIHYEKKWVLADKLGDKAELIKVMGNIANLHRENKHHREALEFYRRVLTLKQKLGNPQELAITHNEVALQLLDLGLSADALVEIDKALEYSQTGITNPKNHGQYLYNRACILFTHSNQAQFQLALQQAVKYAEDNGFEAIQRACKMLESSWAAKKENDTNDNKMFN